MIKINDSWVDIDSIFAIQKVNHKVNNLDDEYEIEVINLTQAFFRIRFFSNEKLRDQKFDELGRMLEHRKKTKQDYIQGFKDGTEYALKLSKDK